MSYPARAEGSVNMINKLSVIWKSDLSDKIKRNFSKQRLCQYCWMDAPYERWLAIWRKSLTAIAQECNELYWTNPGGNIRLNNICMNTYHSSRRPSELDGQDIWDTAGGVKKELISDVLQWNSPHVRASVGQPARTYLQQLCKDTVCSVEGLPEAMDDRDEWRKRVREIRARGMTWWWWELFFIHKYLDR